ncbi:uncharacterized protein [Argopecten irradians]|uniref:uncharacterized protein n=1 Tax=Argopecten irradians TaxID=31199 RepID=UPI003717A564
MATSLPQFPSFIVHGEGSTSVRWKKWKERLDILLVAMDVIENKERKKALLLHYAGEEVQDVFSTLPLLGPPEGEDLDVYKQATEALQAYFTPKKNREYERYKFRQAKQKEGEDIMTYNTRLRKLGENCEFLDLEEEIKSQIIQSCSSTRLRRRVLRDDDMTLGDILKLARSLELSDEQTKEIENKPEQINTIRRNQGRTRDTKRGNKEKGFTKQNQRHGNGYQKTKDKSAECYRCGGSYPHQGQCPAKGKKCNNCQKLNHFSKMCRSKKKELVHKVEKGANHQYDSSGSDDEYVFHVNTRNAGQPKAAVIIHGMPMDIIVDTGATVNILDEKTFQSMKSKPKLQKSNTNLYPYGSGEPIDIVGTFETEIKSKAQKTSTQTTIYVARGNFGSLLSYHTAIALSIIPTIRVVSKSETDSIIEEYQDRFEGIGKIKDVQVKIHVNEEIQPKTQPHRRIPFHMRKKG